MKLFVKIPKTCDCGKPIPQKIRHAMKRGLIKKYGRLRAAKEAPQVIYCGKCDPRPCQHCRDGTPHPGNEEHDMGGGIEVAFVDAGNEPSEPEATPD